LFNAWLNGIGKYVIPSENPAWLMPLREKASNACAVDGVFLGNGGVYDNFMFKSVKKAVIPAAGRGTRLRSLTRHMPKELLPVGAKPMIQHTLEMYISSGICRFCIITSPRKPMLKAFITGNWKPPALPYHRDAELYRKLQECEITFITQDKPRGVADAVSLARDFVGNEPFACTMPDCLLFSPTPLAKQLIAVFEKYGQNVIGTIMITGDDARRFGNVGVLQAERLDNQSFRITSLSDKKREPLSVSPGAVIHKGFGGGIYLPEYFDMIELLRPGAEGEIDDVPIHQLLISKGKLLGALLEGKAFDAGNLPGFRAAVHYAGRRM